MSSDDSPYFQTGAALAIRPPNPGHRQSVPLEVGAITLLSIEHPETLPIGAIEGNVVETNISGGSRVVDSFAVNSSTSRGAPQGARHANDHRKLKLPRFAVLDNVTDQSAYDLNLRNRLFDRYVVTFDYQRRLLIIGVTRRLCRSV